MRKNTQRALDNFLAGRSDSASNRGTAIWTNGDQLYSYGTRLVEKHPDGVLLFNTTRYSVTTTIQQNGLRVELERCGFPLELVDNVPQGSHDLARYRETASA